MKNQSEPTTEFAPQGSDAWHAARLGVITASEFGKLITAKYPAPADNETSRGYAMELAIEKLTGIPQGPEENAAMRWGKLYEAEARESYAGYFDQDVQQVGLLMHRFERDIGGSPDGLIGTSGGVEIKCPAKSAIHLATVLSQTMPPKYKAQVQGHMWLRERDWWDFVSYDPRFDDYRHRIVRILIHRDQHYIDRLEVAVISFRDRLDELMTQLEEME